jgi:hypothetical protein
MANTEGDKNGRETRVPLLVSERIDAVMQPARERWNTLSPEDRATVSYAFVDAVKNPYKVGDYKLTFRKLRAAGTPFEVHEFRIGFVSFVLITAGFLVILYDFWIDEAIALAAE